jgi:hypothetical protein
MLTQPSNAQRPEYKARAYDEGLVLDPSNHGPENEDVAFPRAS